MCSLIFRTYKNSHEEHSMALISSPYSCPVMPTCSIQLAHICALCKVYNATKDTWFYAASGWNAKWNNRKSLCYCCMFKLYRYILTTYKKENNIDPTFFIFYIFVSVLICQFGKSQRHF
ncbi:hypothetical protein AK88_05111 [Plasmodium fragile]|uniref:Uncharacterized protein n=1 Tax=Plasmodium fragile TaxID=5857 RepID=A0A0D9QHS7_PLAFR|nr:uncharacterized protein AK88_05111 [Plasmodium fragile]KJP85271.1 hypothetical protein AK88_05111 [Plasmodium fragile]